jgi:D-beta-D-heptose 7-phosphate kinase/D-beta-D-heptose 1-phosphate adenosyltransferase
MADFADKILTWDQAAQKRLELASSGRKLVFTNGCFDLLHAGHLAYLAEARSLGDYLLVGLNSDQSVRGLKGPRRPIRDEGERALMLAALVMVDGVAVFNEPTPLALIEAVKPDFLAKGGDWAVQDIVGGPETVARGGQVKSLIMKTGYSTTALIERILAAYGQGRA